MKWYRFVLILGFFFPSLFAHNNTSLIRQKNIWKEKKGKAHFCTVGCYPGKDPYTYMSRLFDSAEKHGISLTHIGKEATSWGGNVTKPIWFYEFIKTLPDEDIVVCVDACDVFFCAGQKKIVEKFLEKKAPIVFSTERNCYPQTHLKPYFQKARTSFKYLNAGGFIGYAGALKAMLEEVISEILPGMHSDQALYQTYYVNHSDLIYLDTSCEIFCSLFDVDLKELKVKKGEVRLKETNTYPSIFHGNGGKGKPVFYKLYDKLNS